MSRITNSMLTRKLFLFQAGMMSRCPRLAESSGLRPVCGEVPDIDGRTIRSSSSEKEGAEAGFNKKAKGKPAFSFQPPLSEEFLLILNCLRYQPGKNQKRLSKWPRGSVSRISESSHWEAAFRPELSLSAESAGEGTAKPAK